ncbi:MAG: alpha/beta hydrolase [Clostridia bacterium]|nr:alpha/beta hydrolase [Clostridia bacterium]
MDIQLHYIEEGTGFPLILLHGNGEEHGYFKHQIPYFAQKYRVIALDTRGHGKTPRGEAPFTIRQFAEDLKAFLDEKAIEKAHFLGFSDGGNIALCFAIKYPERVEKLILNGANLYPKGVRWSVQLPIEMGYRLAKGKNKEMLGLMVKDPMIDPAELAAVTMPALVIAGTRDMIKESHTRLIHRSLPYAELAILQGDHFIAAKNPEEFNQTVEKFLNGKR